MIMVSVMGRIRQGAHAEAPDTLIYRASFKLPPNGNIIGEISMK